MTPFRLTPQAVSDIFEIWSHIAEDNMEAANRVESAIFAACMLVADGPLRGQLRTDLTVLPVRFWTIQRYPNYMLVYDPATSPVQIIRVLHGMRDVTHVLSAT